MKNYVEIYRFSSPLCEDNALILIHLETYYYWLQAIVNKSTKSPQKQSEPSPLQSMRLIYFWEGTKEAKKKTTNFWIHWATKWALSLVTNSISSWKFSTLLIRHRPQCGFYQQQQQKTCNKNKEAETKNGIMTTAKRRAVVVVLLLLFVNLCIVGNGNVRCADHYVQIIIVP